MKNKFLNQKTLTVVLCIMMVMVTLGFASSTKTLFPDEIAKELGFASNSAVSKRLADMEKRFREMIK